MSYLKQSDYWGFWLRLKKHGYNIKTQSGNSFAFEKQKSTIFFYIKRHKHNMQIWQQGKLVVDDTQPCWLHLEKEFLKFFNDKKPLQLRRLSDPQRTFAWQTRQRKNRYKRK